MKKYLLMTTCLLAGLYALPAHAILAPTPNVWEFYGADALGGLPTDPIAALDGDPTNLGTTADTNLAQKVFLDQPGGHGVVVTAFYKPILFFIPDSDPTSSGVSPGAGTYALGPAYAVDPGNNSLLQHNRGLDPQPNGDGVGLGIQTPPPPLTNPAFVQSVLNVQGPADQQEYFDEINFNELIQIDLGVDFAKYQDWKIQLSSMNDSQSDLCVPGTNFCYQAYNSAEIYTSSSADPNLAVFGTLLTTITDDFVHSLGSNLQRYLYVNPKALPHTDCFVVNIGDAFVNPNQCTWDTAFLVRSVSATPIPTTTPEPGILGLLGFALAGLGYAKSRRQA